MGKQRRQKPPSLHPEPPERSEKRKRGHPERNFKIDDIPLNVARALWVNDQPYSLRNRRIEGQGVVNPRMLLCDISPNYSFSSHPWLTLLIQSRPPPSSWQQSSQIFCKPKEWLDQAERISMIQGGKLY